MTTDFRSHHFTFSSTSGHEQSATFTFDFGAKVNKADVAIKAFSIGYTAADHNIWRQKINASISAINNNLVTVTVNYLFRDHSGQIDDPYDGTVDVLVIASVADRTSSPTPSIHTTKIGTVASLAPGATYLFQWNNPPWSTFLSYFAYPVPMAPVGEHGSHRGSVQIGKITCTWTRRHDSSDPQFVSIEIINTGTEVTGFDLFESWVS